MTTTTDNEIDLYTDKGACVLCSSTFVQHRVDQYERGQHAVKHVEQGDKVRIEMPHTFKVATN